MEYEIGDRVTYHGTDALICDVDESKYLPYTLYLYGLRRIAYASEDDLRDE